MTFLLRFIIGLLLFTLTNEAQAVTRYVTKTGSDSNSCTAAQTVGTAKLTIAAGIACTQAGDTLSIGNGTYAERIANGIVGGSSWATATTIKATNNLQAIIKPTGNGRTVSLTTAASAWIIFDGLVFDGDNDTTSILFNIDSAAHHIRLQNSELRYGARIAGVGLFPSSNGATPITHHNEILNNWIHHNGVSDLDHGIYMTADNNIIEGNILEQNCGYGLQMYDGYAGGNRAHHNIVRKNISKNHGRGLTASPGSTCSVFTNFAGFLISAGSNNEVYNNLALNNGTGIRMQYSAGCDNCLVYSNTVYGNTEGITILAGSDNNIVRNNILYQNSTNYTNSGTGNTQSNNLGISSSPNPLFVNAGASDFHIQSGSPARDTGFTLGSPYNVDFAGTARPQGASYDIGAYEFLTGSAPAAPTSPTATPGDTQITVGWTASAGATSYSVFRSTVDGGSYSVVVTGDTASPYVDTGLTNGTTYYYVIQAVNASGSSQNSTQTSATPQPPAPSAPTGLQATAGDTQVSLAWTATAGADTYNVLRSTTSGSGYASIVTGLPSPSYLNTGLTNNTTYYYVVTATNGGGTSANSAQAGATPTTPPPPIAAPPTNFIATAGDTEVSLSWTASATADTYTVKRGTVGGGPYGTTVISALAGTSYVDTGRTNGVTYYYVVTAVNAGGESGNSTEASTTPQIPIAAAPADLTPTAGDTQVNLTWTAAAGATSYSAYKATITGGPYGAAVATGITATTYTVTSLTNDTPYFFVVTAVNAGGESVLSAEVTATPQPAVPAAPTGLGVTASNQQIILSWSAVAGADFYTVSRATASGGALTLIATGIVDPTYTDIDPLNGIPYYYLITATNINGTSGTSTEISATARVPAQTHIIGTTTTAGRVLTH